MLGDKILKKVDQLGKDLREVGIAFLRKYDERTEIESNKNEHLDHIASKLDDIDNKLDDLENKKESDR